MLETKYNFTTLLKITSGWTAASPSTDNVDGQIGFLHHDKAVFSVSPLRLTSGRVLYADYVTFTWYPAFVFLFKHPKSTSIGSQYLLPFQSTVWLAIVISLMSVGFILSVYLKEKSIGEPNIPDSSTFSTFLWIFGYVCQQYAAPLPSHNSARTTIISLVFLAYIAYQYYCTFIIGSLITETAKTIKTVQDVVDSGLEIGVTKAPYNRDLFLEVSTK